MFDMLMVASGSRPRSARGLGDHLDRVADQKDIAESELTGDVQSVEQGLPLRFQTRADSGQFVVIGDASGDDGRLHLSRVRPTSAVEENLHERPIIG